MFVDDMLDDIVKAAWERASYDEQDAILSCLANFLEGEGYHVCETIDELKEEALDYTSLVDPDDE